MRLKRTTTATLSKRTAPLILGIAVALASAGCDDDDPPARTSRLRTPSDAGAESPVTLSFSTARRKGVATRFTWSRPGPITPTANTQRARWSSPSTRTPTPSSPKSRTTNADRSSARPRIRMATSTTRARPGAPPPTACSGPNSEPSRAWFASRPASAASTPASTSRCRI